MTTFEVYLDCSPWQCFIPFGPESHCVVGMGPVVWTHLMDREVVSPYGRLESCCLGVYLGTELLGHVVILCLIFGGTTKPFDINVSDLMFALHLAGTSTGAELGKHQIIAVWSLAPRVSQTARPVLCLM